MNELNELNEEYGSVYVLLDDGADPNCIGFDGSSPLIRALSSCDTDSANLLIENGADLDFKWKGMSPMDISVSLSDFMSVKMLKGHQADSYKQNLLASFNKFNDLDRHGVRYIDAALHYSIEENDCEEIEFLIDEGANINSEDWCGLPSLFVAVQCNSVGAAEILIRHKVNLDINFEEKSLLQFAINYNQKEMIDLIKSCIENEQLISLIDSETVLDSPLGIQF